jgi:hypothetical protein
LVPGTDDLVPSGQLLINAETGKANRESSDPLKTIELPGGKQIAANGMLVVGCLS